MSLKVSNVLMKGLMWCVCLWPCSRLDWAGPWQTYPGQAEVLGETEGER